MKKGTKVYYTLLIQARYQQNKDRGWRVIWDTVEDLTVYDNMPAGYEFTVVVEDALHSQIEFQQFDKDGWYYVYAWVEYSAKSLSVDRNIKKVWFEFAKLLKANNG